jgi:hypothetical protein
MGKFRCPISGKRRNFGPQRLYPRPLMLSFEKTPLA